MKIKQTLELLPWVHKSKARIGGMAPLYIRITIMGYLSNEVTVGSISPSNWDVTKKSVLKDEPGYRDINNRITEISGELITIFKSLCTQYGQEHVTPLMVKQEYSANRKRSRNSLQACLNPVDVNKVKFAECQANEQRSLQSPKPLASDTAGNALSPFSLIPPASLVSSDPRAGILLHEIQALFNTMQVKLSGLMFQLASYGPLTAQFAPINSTT